VAILVEILLVPVEKEEQQNVILGQAHFIKTVEISMKHSKQ